MESRTLKDYLNAIKACEDTDRLKHEFKIKDNWSIYLYGDRETLYSKVTQAFNDSGKPSGIRDKWYFGYDVDKGKTYYFEPGIVLAQVIKIIRHPDAINGDEDKIYGEEFQVFVMFHPYQEKKMENVPWIRAIALAIAGVGDYIIRENITARFPLLDLNHVPDTNHTLIS